MVAKRGIKSMKKKCIIANCHNDYYAHGLCKNHYQLSRRNGAPKRLTEIFIKCSVEGCKAQIRKSSFSGLCPFHRDRRWKGIPLERGYGIKGELNPRWNGGISEYPNHLLFKKNRIEVLEEADYTCWFCGKININEVHHQDGLKTNHAKENLKACCHACNGKKAQVHNSKFRRLYGRTLTDLSHILNL